MDPSRPSVTASVVSFLRGLATTSPTGPCFDPVARELLPPPFTQLLSVLDRSGPARGLLKRPVELLAGGLAGHIELRTAVIDDALRRAVATGIRQLVILGAGLDARAWRMPELAEVEVIEVDHPATQAWKEPRVSGRRALAKSVQFAPVDFERDRLEDTLVKAGHRPGEATFWIWEGVTPYLRRAAISSTLEVLARRSLAGSLLSMSYLTPETVALPLLGPLARPWFHLISEPLHGRIPREEVTRMLAALGWEVRSDVLPSEVGRRYGRSTRRGIVTPAERVLLAERALTTR